MLRVHVLGCDKVQVKSASTLHDELQPSWVDVLLSSHSSEDARRMMPSPQIGKHFGKKPDEDSVNLYPSAQRHFFCFGSMEK